ncbi:MAG: DUF47 family protein [Acidimicrobiales bacterium]|nr:DUF47 family protein [Acidimicrobiales bacterium]
MKRWFLPHTPDVLALLRGQADITLTGLEAFVAWSEGHLENAQRLRDAEHRADEARRHLQAELRAAFSTPIDAEDVYVLSERLDAVINGAKDAVREAEVMGMDPDPALADMAGQVLEGTRHLAAAFDALLVDADRATAEADAAIKATRRLERTYRKAMSALLAEEELRVVIAQRELYRRYARLGEGVEAVAERVWYAVVKEG